MRAVEVSGDIVSSALYTANWHFAAQSVDYFAQDIEPSPVLHLWSLAIEEQFYLVWPTLLLAVTWFWRRRGGSVRPALWVTLAIVLVGSFALGVKLTGDQPAAAYFSTFGRAWELGLGAALALLGAVRIRRVAGAAIGWAGLAAIVYAAVAFDASTPFPGTAALLPTVGAACLILAGASLYGQAKAAPAGLLSLAPVRYVGRISYSWYLWHWPALIFAAAIWGPLSVAAGLAVVAVSWIPTAATHHLIEDPVRLSRVLARRPNRALAIGLACMAIGVCAGVALRDVQPTLDTAPLADVKGAAALAEQPYPQQRADAVRPNPLRARDDRSRAYYDGCLVGIDGTNSNKCLYGDPNAKRTLILFGDSHAMQYFPALEELAETRHWRLITLTKAECTPGEVQIRSMVADREYSQCDAWREEPAADRNGRPQDRRRGDERRHRLHPLRQRRRRTERRRGRRRDGSGLPREPDADPPRRPADGGDQGHPGLGQRRPRLRLRRPPAPRVLRLPRVRDRTKEFDARAAKAAPGTHLIDINPEICPDGLCRAVIGNALVYRDKSHLTATFARTLAPGIERDLKKAGLA